ncbi:MAG TPA: hypothetical protein VK177_10365 [Flavobacteriales bacterium]|nr:hypothetical protein [Flavobacteriales bacterium]
MKRLIVLMILFQGFSLVSTAQVPGQKLVPKPVLDQYALDFAGITPKRWEVKVLKQFEAVLIHNNKECRARYANDGKKISTSYHWNGADVPSVISSSLLTQFPGFKIEWATQIINHVAKTDRFWVRLTKPGFILKAFVNADGTVVTGAKEDEMKEFDQN